jgi:hypothetical protein
MSMNTLRILLLTKPSMLTEVMYCRRKTRSWSWAAGPSSSHRLATASCRVNEIMDCMLSGWYGVEDSDKDKGGGYRFDTVARNIRWARDLTSRTMPQNHWTCGCLDASRKRQAACHDPGAVLKAWSWASISTRSRALEVEP